jgi:hypothetical protein
MSDAVIPVMQNIFGNDPFIVGNGVPEVPFKSRPRSVDAARANQYLRRSYARATAGDDRASK